MTISTDMLTAFVRVSERLSVSAAAADLGVCKSVVSKRVAQLESSVQTTLFSRSTRKVALTAAGEAYLGFARRALVEMASAQERLRDLRAELSGQIRLTAPVSWGQRMLSRALPEFLDMHPGIELELRLSDKLMDLAYERIDIALRWTSAPPPDLAALPIASIDWLLVASPDYVARAGTPTSPQDLTTHPCLCYWRETDDDIWVLRSGERQERVCVRGRYHADNAEAVAAAVLAGLGIAQLPGYLCADELRSGALVHLLPAWQPQTKFATRITAVAAPERIRIARNQALLHFLRGKLAS